MQASVKVNPSNKTKSKKKKNKNKNKNKQTKLRGIPIAIAAKPPATRFQRISSRNNEQDIVVAGEDLIIPVPDTLGTDVGGKVFLSFPANPLYWSGTRLAGLARVYQQYRPLKLEVEYVPQVPVTIPGQVIMGTLWNVESRFTSLQQNLMTSDGARMVQCYERCVSRVNLKSSRLPQRFFNVFGDMSSQSCNPFMWLAYYTGTSDTVSQPGYIYVRWKYRFTVAVGDRDMPVETINQYSDSLVQKLKRNTTLTNAAGWGVPLSILRTFKTILRNTTIFFLREVAAAIIESLPTNQRNGENETTTIGVGRCYNVDVGTLNEQNISVTDDTGNHYAITDDSVRVCIYSHGNEVEIEPETYINYYVEFDSSNARLTGSTEKASALVYVTTINALYDDVTYPNVITVRITLNEEGEVMTFYAAPRAIMPQTMRVRLHYMQSLFSGRDYLDVSGNIDFMAAGELSYTNVRDGGHIPFYFTLDDWLEVYPLV